MRKPRGNNYLCSAEGGTKNGVYCVITVIYVVPKVAPKTSLPCGNNYLCSVEGGTGTSARNAKGETP